MLTYTLEKREKESLYEQLYRFIREDILSGRCRRRAALKADTGAASGSEHHR